MIGMPSTPNHHHGIFFLCVTIKALFFLFREDALNRRAPREFLNDRGRETLNVFRPFSLAIGRPLEDAKSHAPR